jgi:hypothetical protein
MQSDKGAQVRVSHRDQLFAQVLAVGRSCLGFTFLNEGQMKSRLGSAKFLLCATVGIFLFVFVLWGCGGSNSPTPPRVLISVSVQPNSASAVKNRGVAFSATGTFNQTPTIQAYLNAAWASSDVTIATIDPASGLASCVSVGGPVTVSASVTAAAGGIKQSSGALTCNDWSTIPRGRCVVDSNNVLTGQCAGPQFLFPENCSVTTDTATCSPEQQSTSTQNISCGTGPTAMDVAVDISTACK